MDIKEAIMIYQFEHEEIKRCRECPCHSWADFPDEKDWCDLQDKQLAYDTEPGYNDCPLVAISKTETTSNSCWYCDGIQDHKIVSVKTVGDEFGRELTAYDTPYNYCPNCGQKLDWRE